MSIHPKLPRFVFQADPNRAIFSTKKKVAKIQVFFAKSELPGQAMIFRPVYDETISNSYMSLNSKKTS